MQKATRHLSSRTLVKTLGFAAALACAPVFAQTSTAPAGSTTTGVAAPSVANTSCILAGRLNGQQIWAPLARGVTLLDAQGKAVNASSRQALGTVKAVRLTEPALVAQCNGSQALPSGDIGSGSKTPVPVVKPGPMALDVQAMYFPPARVGGLWVELQLALPADRMLAASR